ncbi:MAG TPA: hypothetical protein VNP72_02360, partial [Longimicrobium sp.]|nr:hypothetical protein [Longimicrobium sp.]
MSVLSFPRIYFKGYLGWDPCTLNNNDFSQDPTYAAAEAALNWPFLAGAGITPENFQSTFRPWARTYQPGPTGPNAVPAEWNMFGSHAVNFVQYQDFTTAITGGATGPQGPVASDPLVGGPVALAGNGPPAVLVDTNPISFWSSQVYWGNLSLGGGGTVIGLPMSVRMHARWVSPFRIFNPPASIMAAAGFSCCFQTGVPFDQVSWPAAGASPLADALRQAAQAPGAQGVMVRFTAYVNLYFQNGIYNDIPITPRNYVEVAAALEAAWQKWNDDGDTSLFYSNPCYSHIVGVVGVWNDGELASAPGGRYLVAQTALTAATGATGATGLPASTVAMSTQGHVLRTSTDPEQVVQALLATGGTASPPPSSPLGPVVASIDEQLGIVSLDFGSAIPERASAASPPSDLEKTDFGPLSLGLLGSGGLTPLGTIDYAQYGRQAYEASAGIIDLPLPPSLSGPVQGGTLVISAMGQTALLEQNLSAQTDSRGIYLDQGQSTTFGVSVYENGTPSPGTNVLVARYGRIQQIPANYGKLNLVPVGPTAPTGATGPVVQVVDFTNGTQTTIDVGGRTTGVTIVTADQTGVAQVGLEAQGPGFMVLGFYPYPPSGPTPTPPSTLLGQVYSQFVTYADYTTIRVLPFDDAVPQAFVDLWNATHDPALAWDFIYQPPPLGAGILYVYDMVFSVMLEYVDLGSRSAVEQNIAAIWSLTRPDSAAEGSGNMPITR